MDQETVDKTVAELWVQVVSAGNTLLAQADIYGFQLMNLPDPNVHNLVNILEKGILPIIDNLINEYEFSPESGVKIANIKETSTIFRGIVNALNNEDIATFNKEVARLQDQAMLC